MAYSELIKNFNKIREYMRQFYVYGFRSRSEFDFKSARSYDNEHRRLQSWLGEYMRFRHEEDGKVVFMSIDGRNLPCNPLYKAFKTKSFTDNDITFHFFVLDLLAKEQEYSASNITSLISSEYLSYFDNSGYCDESTIRKKLKEYVRTGILKERKQGKELLYSRNESNLNPDSWSDAVSFFSEYSPLGVIGSYISDCTGKSDSPFRFKHRYIFQALDSQILYMLITAINESRDIRPKVKTKRIDLIGNNSVHPLKIYISTQNGRQYLLCYHIELNRLLFIRLDNIIDLTIADVNENRETYLKECELLKKHLWGVSAKEPDHLEKIEMTIHIEEHEEFVFNRLMKEKRCGSVIRKDPHTCVFTAEVYDAMELVPWIRTYIGRIEDFYCSNPEVTNCLNRDIEKLDELYGGVCDAV